MKALLACSLLFAASLVAVSAPGSPVIAAEKDGIRDQYVVLFKKGTSDVAGKSHRLKASGRLKSVYASALKGFSVNTTASEAARIAEDPSVQAVYQDREVTLDDTQTIPKPPNTYWGLNRIDQRTLPPEAAGTYTWTYNGAGVNAYIVDTGINVTHAEFQTDGVSRATFDYTAAGQDKPGEDCWGHGTHVAGTVGGNTYGVAKKVKLHAVKVFSCSGASSWSAIIEGIDWVTANAVKPAVGNMSLGGLGDSPPITQAVNNSIAAGITWTVSAGNDGKDACEYSPANVPGVITVGATGERVYQDSPMISDIRPGFSNYGSCVDIFAPGSEIKSASRFSDTGSAVMSGTSMAAPHVTGVAALILQKSPKLDPMAVRDIIIDFSTKGMVKNPGAGSPNRLLYSGNTPSLTVNATPEPMTCTAFLNKVSGTLTLQGMPLGNVPVEIWYNRKGSTPPVRKVTVTTNYAGVYSRSMMEQAYDGYWYAVYRGQVLVAPRTSPNDYVDCKNR